jgi:DNA (cytosine-5)-methyltransferase 3A
MNVLSLFDGMSCGQQALQRAGINYDNYFASEIDKYAIQVTMHNYPNTIQLGSVVNVDGYKLPKIDLLIGGSPCQSFSFAGKRKGMSTKDEQEIFTLEHYLQLKSEGYEFEGQSYLFWEYMRIMNEVKPKYFLLENVMMGEKWEKVLSRAIGVNPIEINSALVSAQNRKRLYWTNIGMKPAGLFGDLENTIKQPKDLGILLKDILEPEVDEKYFLSQKMIDGFLGDNKNHEGKTGFVWQPTEGNKKGACLRANAALCATDNSIIVHNTMPRSSKSGKGGTAPLSRNDGKTYCLDTGNTNAVEIKYQKEIFNSLNNEKATTLDSSYYKGFGVRSGVCRQIAELNSRIRRLTPTECERLQTVRDNYTSIVSDTQRYKMLGNGWTVDVIAHIFKYMEL